MSTNLIDAMVHRWQCLDCSVAWCGKRTEPECWFCGKPGQITSGFVRNVVDRTDETR